MATADCRFNNFLKLRVFETQGPDLQNILRQSYDYLTIIPKLRSTYDGRLIYQTSYEERKAFLMYTIYMQNHKIVADTCSSVSLRYS